MIEKLFVKEGIKKVRLNEHFEKELDRAGYGGMEIKRTPMGTQITLRVEKPGMIIGKDGRKIKKLTEDVQRRHELDNPQLDVQTIEVPELCATLMASRLAKLIERGWHFRRAGRSMLQRIMESGALGCEIVMSGKLKGPRGRMEKMVDGYIKHCGEVAEEMVDRGYAIAKVKSGTIGVQVWIVRPDAERPDAFRIIKKEREEEAEAEVEEGEEEEGGEEEETMEQVEDEPEPEVEVEGDDSNINSKQQVVK